MSDVMRRDTWKEPFDVRVLQRRADPRGFLFEVLRFRDEHVPGEGQLYTFSIEPGQKRGEHYHLRKREWFTCVHGRANILLISQDGQMHEVALSSDEPKVIYVGPGTSHALINQTDQVAVIVSYGSEQHSPGDEDTYTHGKTAAS